MRFTKKKIEEVVVRILGEEGLKIVEELSEKENVSEFDLSKRIKEDIKVVRKMLYMLYNHNLVGFTRKKDKQKGWYIYYWTLLPANIEFSYFKQRKEQLEKLKQRLDEEHKELFFACPDKCVRLNFDQGMDFEFHCPECGKLMVQDTDKEEIKKNICAEIETINGELKMLHEKKAVRRKARREHKKPVTQRKMAKKNEKPETKSKKIVSVSLLKKTAKKLTQKLIKAGRNKKSRKIRKK